MNVKGITLNSPCDKPIRKNGKSLKPKIRYDGFLPNLNLRIWLVVFYGISTLIGYCYGQGEVQMITTRK